MATITREPIGHLHEKLIVALEKSDYLPSFEKGLKEYSKKANIPGFRKGMVPAGLIKKMYGSALFNEEVLKTVERELTNYLQQGNLDIFAQPLPLDADFSKVDINHPDEYSFGFEIGLKPQFTMPELEKAPITKYVISITDEMIDNEVSRLQNRYGTMKDEETVASEEHLVNVLFTETDELSNPIENGISKDNSLLVKYFKEGFREQLLGKTINENVVTSLEGAFEEKELDFIMKDLGLDPGVPADCSKYFSIKITKIGLLEKKELHDEFFKQVYPGFEIQNENEFREKIKEEIQQHWNRQVINQIHDQVFHYLTDHTEISFPEAFLKKWMASQGKEPGKEVKTEEQLEQEFPVFLNQLKWTLITDKVVHENNIQVTPEEIRGFARQQLFSYMGGTQGPEEQPWVTDYVEKMMKDRKYIEDAYSRIQTQKIFEWASTRVQPEDKDISAEEFSSMVEAHRHHHH